MAITVKLRQLKITARKTRMVADLVRYKTTAEAEAILSFTPNKASLPLLKLLRSGMAAAKNTHKLDPKDFYISKLTVDDGPMHKKVFPRSRGRADRIEKRTSHITLTIDKKVQEPAVKSKRRGKKEA
jgi:large subunit ribosomal protein L22